MQKPLLIGLSGKAGSGKSTAADYLTRAHGFYQFAFADGLKEIVQRAFGFSEKQLYGGFKEVGDPRWGVSPRWCLQWLGTEVFRSRWPDIWIRRLKEDIRFFSSRHGPYPFVVTDVRFVNEAEALRRMGARLVRIERVKAGASGNLAEHVSEIELDFWTGWDFLIVNKGSLAELYAQLDHLIIGLAHD